jgi:hypothetical protein
MGRQRFLWMGAGILALALCAAPVHAQLVIVPTFDPTWFTNPNAAAATACVNRVITEIEGLFSNNATVNITFEFGQAGAGGAFEQEPNFSPTLTLSQVTTMMTNHANAHPENAVLNTAKAFYPSSYNNPNGSNGFYMNDAEYMALNNGAKQNGDLVNATISLGPDFPGQPWNYGTTGMNGTIFAQGVFEHEITHAMGRIDYAFAGTPFLLPLDLYKYDPGTTTLDPLFNTTAFSYDGGTTQAAQEFANFSDSGDWGNANGDSFNAFDGPFLSMSQTDLNLMYALGWDPIVQQAPVPEPAAIALLGIGLAGIAGARLRRRKQIAA